MFHLPFFAALVEQPTGRQEGIIVSGTLTEACRQMSTFKALSAAKCHEVCPDVAGQLEKANVNARFLQANHKQLKRKYPGQWVAIGQGRVVWHGDSLSELTSKLSEIGISQTELLTHFVSATKQVFIL